MFNKEIVSYLMNAGAKLGNSDNGLDCLLYLAKKTEQAGIVEMLLNGQHMPQAVGIIKQTSLLQAAE